MKFLHCSDLHLGRRPAGGQGNYSRKRYEDFFTVFDQIIDIAISEQVTVLLIAGDLFDRKELSPQVLEATERRLEKIKTAGIQVLITEGNHDNITRGREEESWLQYLEGKKLFTRLSCTIEKDKFHFQHIEVDGITFYGAGYPGAFVNETLKALAEQLDNTKADKHVILVHTAVTRGDFLPGTVDPETINLFKNKAVYIAAGHFHSYNCYPKENPIFFIPGAPEYWDLGEKGKRGCIIFDTSTGKHHFHSSSPRQRIEISIKIDIKDKESFEPNLLQKIQETPIRKGEDLLFITIHQNRSFYIDTGWCEEQGQKAGALKTIVSIDSPDTQIINNTKATRTVDKIEEDLIEGWEFFSEHKGLVTKALQKFKTFQQENNEDLFLESLNSMIEKILEGDKI